MNILFLHQNFPAQFRHVAARLAADGAHRVIAVGEDGNLRRTGAPLRGVELAPCAPAPTSSASHRYLQGYDAAIRRGQQVVGVLRQLKAGGFRPDLVVAHPGWGNALFLRDVFADAPIALHAEYYYHATGADVGCSPKPWPGPSTSATGCSRSAPPRARPWWMAMTWKAAACPGNSSCCTNSSPGTARLDRPSARVELPLAR